MASMIKQDGWNDKTHTGSFAKNKENPNGRVVVKLGNAEVAGIIDALESNRDWSTYHVSSKQKLQINFGKYNRNNEQIGYSFSVNKQDTQDSTNKVGFIIGFNFPEGRYLREYLIFLLREWFLKEEAKHALNTPKKTNSYQDKGSGGHTPEIEFEASDLSEENDQDFEW